MSVNATVLGVPLPSNLNFNDPSPEWMNKEDNAWELTVATLVGLQIVPGQIILYGAAVKKKWAINSAFMALYAFACVLICWVLWGYRLSFGNKLNPFWGKVNLAVDQKFLLHQAFAGMFPSSTMLYLQFVFAAITLIQIAGAVLGRMNFVAWMLFVPMWLTFSYAVGAFSIWSPNGFFTKLGLIDYSGGYVIHLSSGVAGFTAAYWVGPRMSTDRENFHPNNVLFRLAGAGLLWMGWTGFIDGDPSIVRVDDAPLAALNTHICTLASLLTWLVLDVIFFKKPSIIGAIQGMMSGLVCITPAAGVVQGWAPLLIGILSGSIPWFTMMVINKKSKLLQVVHDTMAVFHTHAVAGSLGGILTGLFAEPRLCYLFYNSYGNYVGLFYSFQMGSVHRGFRQIRIQLLGVLFIVTLNVVTTSLICLFVQLIVPLRMSEAYMAMGDEAGHGIEAHAIWGDGEKLKKFKHGGMSYSDVEMGKA